MEIERKIKIVAMIHPFWIYGVLIVSILPSIIFPNFLSTITSQNLRLAILLFYDFFPVAIMTWTVCVFATVFNIQELKISLFIKIAMILVILNSLVGATFSTLIAVITTQDISLGFDISIEFYLSFNTAAALITMIVFPIICWKTGVAFLRNGKYGKINFGEKIFSFLTMFFLFVTAYWVHKRLLYFTEIGNKSAADVFD